MGISICREGGINGNMPKVIFNEYLGIDDITIVLERRDFYKYGKLSDVKDIEYKCALNAPELSFTVYKTENDLWEKINNYNLVFIPEYKEHFSISVNTTEESTNQKSVTCTYLPLSELQNIKLRNIEINTEDDIARDDYDPDYPTIFYRDLSLYSKDSKMYKKLYNASLLHRILDKATNYKIGHVDLSLKNLKSWFQYSISSSTIYDELTGEIADDYQCLFVFDSSTRTVNVYDLCNTCKKCGYRGDFHDTCPECGSKDIGGAYGEDTTIYISKENLATSASIESSKDNLKNCFYITGGDDLMTAAVAIANPNGSNYIYGFSDEMFENMPSDLVEKIKAYNTNYQYCFEDKKFTVSSNLVKSYNEIVNYVNKYYPIIDEKGDKTDRYSIISSPIVGYKNIASLCFDCIDIGLTLQTSMGKTIEMDNLTIQETMNLLNAGNLSPVAVKSNVSKVSTSVVTSTIKNACKSLINTSLYKIEIVDESYSSSTHNWKGKFKLISIEDESITLTGNFVTINVNNDMEKYLKQNIQRNLNKLETNYKDLRDVELPDADFKSELAYYSYDYLSTLKDTYTDILSIILESGQDELKEKYQTWYSNHILWIETEMISRQKQIDTINLLYDYNKQSGVICDIQASLQNELNLQLYLGSDMWNTFCAFRMEDDYQNDHYISDGLDNSKLVNRATELIEAAKKELYKASHVQYTVTATIDNLLALPEFTPIMNQFEIGNWIHVCVDDKIYYLRLLSYKIFYEDTSKIEVEFSTVERTWSGTSDIESVMNSAQSIAASFSYTAQKVKNNATSSKYVQNWVEKGMEATATKIVNNAYNQNLVYDSSGLLCRTYDDLSDVYDLCQSRLINSGLYVTDDGWKSVKAAVGKYIFVDPETGEEMTTMGVLGNLIVGKMFVGNNLTIYGANNSIVLDENGITLDGGSITWKSPIVSSAVDGLNTFKSNVASTLGVTTITSSSIISPKIGGGYLYIKKEGGCGVEINPLGNNYNGNSGDIFCITNANGERMMGVDKNGNGYFDGKIITSSGEIGGFTIGSNAIYKGTTSLESTTAGVYIGVDGIRQYKNKNAYISIKDGILECMGANIRGGIYCDSSFYMKYSEKDQSGIDEEWCEVMKMDFAYESTSLYINTPVVNLPGADFISGGSILIYNSMYAYGGIDVTGSLNIDDCIKFTNINNGVYDSVQFRKAGNSGSHTLSLVTYKGSSAVKFINLVNADGTAAWSSYLPLSGGTMSGNITISRGSSQADMELKTEYGIGRLSLNTSAYFGLYASNLYNSSGWILYLDSVNSIVNIGSSNINLTKIHGTLICGKVSAENYSSNIGISSELYIRSEKYVVIGSEYTNSGTYGTRVVLSTNQFRPHSDNGDNIMLGTASYKWKQLYAATSTISTSDRNLKKDIKPLTKLYKEFFMKLIPVSYLFKDGESGRTHIGFIAQDVEDAMNDLGMTSLDFAGFCKDVKMKTIKKYKKSMDNNINIHDNEMETDCEDLDENGNEQYVYSLRYEEFIALNTYAIQNLWKELEELKNEIKRN